MTNDELKKAINWQFQLSTFAIIIKDETQGNAEWQGLALRISDLSKEMNTLVQKEMP